MRVEVEVEVWKSENVELKKLQGVVLYSTTVDWKRFVGY
jgi:hypothetical protein